MKPMIICGEGVLAPDEAKKLEDNGICVVVAKEPEKLRFVDSVPDPSKPKVERAAIMLSRILLNGKWGNYTTSGAIGRDTFARIFADLVIKGSPLDEAVPTEEDRQKHYEREKWEELTRIAREDARKEAAEKRAAKAQAKKG